MKYFESKGIPNVNKIFCNQIFDLFKNNSYGIFYINLYQDNIKIKNVKIDFKKDEWYSTFKPNMFKLNNNIISDVELNFYIPIYDENKIKEEITHELNHLYEFYNIIIKNRKLPYHITLKNAIIFFKNKKELDIKNKINNNEDVSNDIIELNTYECLKNIIYLTLDDELNARVSSLYQYLFKFNSLDKKYLTEKLKESDVWKSYEILINDNPKNLYNYFIRNLGVDASLILINELNNDVINISKKYKVDIKDIFIKELKNETELLNYFTKIYKNFNLKLLKHKSKMLRIIDEIISDGTTISEAYLNSPTNHPS